MDYKPNNVKNSSADLSMFILDVLRYDIEPMDSIIKLLNDDGCIGWRHLWSRDFTISDVLPELKKLLQMQFLDIYELDDSNTELIPVEPNEINIDERGDEYWYLITDTGQKAWKDWEPPVSDE